MQSGATICLALAGMVVPLQGVQGESPLHKRMKKIWSALLTKTTIHYPKGVIPNRSKGMDSFCSPTREGFPALRGMTCSFAGNDKTLARDSHPESPSVITPQG